MVLACNRASYPIILEESNHARQNYELDAILITVEQGPTALAVGAGGGCLDIFTLNYAFFLLSPSLWETARYRLKKCLKGPLSPRQPTNQNYGSTSSLEWI